MRIDGLRFTVEDASEAQAQARADATRAAMAHAQQIAGAAGVELGAPVSLSESGASSVRLKSFEQASLGLDSMTTSSSTPIEAGELEVVVTVNAVFAIS